MTLPNWVKDDLGAWTCADVAELAFAQKCRWLLTTETSFTFDVPEFDRWLSDQPDGKTKTHLLAVRAKAKAATSVATRLAYLTQLQANWQAVPQIRKAARKGSRSARRPKLAAWLDTRLRLRADSSAKELWKELPGKAAGEDLYREDEDHVTELGDNDEPLKPLTFKDGLINRRATTHA